MNVNSDVADELHVHSTPDHTFKVEAKPAQTFQFTVDVPGKVDIELHQLNKHDRHHQSAVNPDPSVGVLAHGLGGSTDLPIPYTYALIGAAWALTFTFAVVALAWRRPRFDPDKPGRALPAWVTTFVDAPVTRWAVGIAGLLFAVWVAVAGFFGPQDANNPLPGVFYVLHVGGAGGAVAVVRAGVAGAFAGAHGASAARRPVTAPRIPGGVGLLACGTGPVRVRVAGTREP